MTTAAVISSDDPATPVCDTRDRRRSPGRRQHHREIDRAAAITRALRRRLAGALGAARRRRRSFSVSAQATDAPWTTVTYSDALRQVRSAAAWILAQGLSAERPLVILSDNSVDHALFALAAMHVGVPSAAISPAYSLMSKDFDKLKSMIALLEPGAIYVSSIKPFAAALAAIQPLHAAKIVSGDAGDSDAISFPSIAATPETAAVATAFAAVTPDTIAKFLFTSGSTGTPKAVINTQRMLTSSQQAKAQTWTFLENARRSGDPGLAAVEPYVRRQPQFQSGAAQRRHALCRRRQAGAGAVRDLAGQSAQRDADGVFQCAARLRHADRGVARATKNCAGASSAR